MASAYVHLQSVRGQTIFLRQPARSRMMEPGNIKVIDGGFAMNRCWALGVLLACALGARAEDKRGIDIWFVDTEGGAATLIVTPARESILIDCGNPRERDAERIRKTARLAGIDAIDHLVITHWHLDHYGGVGHLAKLMPIRHFYDHGIPEKLDEDKANFPILIGAYKAASQGKSRTLRPGDTIPLASSGGAPLSLACVCGSGETLPDKAGARANPLARDHQPRAIAPSDNDRSLGFLLSFGGFRFLDLGDLTWNEEYKLVHPSDKIGPIDVYQSTHHGLEISNNPVLIRTVQPRVAIFNNGARKGGHTSVIGALRRLPEPPAIYQMHRNVLVGAQENTDPEFIANPDEKCQAEGIHLSIAPDAKSYSVTVGSGSKTRKYATRNGS